MISVKVYLKIIRENGVRQGKDGPSSFINYYWYIHAELHRRELISWKIHPYLFAAANELVGLEVLGSAAGQICRS